jgi:hypothetical protein
MCYLNILLHRKLSIYESFQMVLLDLKSLFLREVPTCLRGHKAVLFHLAKFLLEALHMHNVKDKNIINVTRLSYGYDFMK